MYCFLQNGNRYRYCIKIQNITKDGQGRLIIKAGKPDDISGFTNQLILKVQELQIGKYAGNCRGAFNMSIFRKIPSEVPAGGLTLGGSIPVPGKLKFDLNHKFNDR